VLLSSALEPLQVMPVGGCLSQNSLNFGFVSKINVIVLSYYILGYLLWGTGYCSINYTCWNNYIANLWN
jgi:hypothetical protein